MHSEAFPSRLVELVFGFRGLAAALSSEQPARRLDVGLRRAPGEELGSPQRRDLLGHRRRHELVDARAVGLADLGGTNSARSFRR